MLYLQRNFGLIFDADWSTKNGFSRFLPYVFSIAFAAFCLSMLVMTIGQSSPNSDVFFSVMNGLTNPDKFNLFGTFGFMFVFLNIMILTVKWECTPIRKIAGGLLVASANFLIVAIGIFAAVFTMLFLTTDMMLWKLIVSIVLVFMVLLIQGLLAFIVWHASEMVRDEDNYQCLKELLAALDFSFVLPLSTAGFFLSAYLSFYVQ